MQRKILVLLTLLFTTLLLSPPTAFAEEIKEVRLSVIDDTSISQTNPDSIYGSRTAMTAGLLQPQAYNIVLLKFSTSAIPKGSVIGSATLLFSSYACSGDDNDPRLQMVHAGKDWNEETVRWNSKPNQGLEIASADAKVGVKSFDMTKAVDSWVKGTTPNYGVMVIPQGGPYSCNFYTKERTNDGVNLVVRFIPPDTTKPVISQTTAKDISFSGAVITWTTNEESGSSVDYYTPSSSGLPTIMNAGQNTLTTSHAVSLKNLSAGKKYYFRVKSKDKAGNEAISGYTSLTTKSIFIPISAKIPSTTVLTAVGGTSGGSSAQNAAASATPVPTPADSIPFDSSPPETTTTGNSAQNSGDENNETLVGVDAADGVANTLIPNTASSTGQEKTASEELKTTLEGKDIKTMIIIGLLVAVAVLSLGIATVLVRQKSPQLTAHPTENMSEKTSSDDGTDGEENTEKKTQKKSSANTKETPK